MPLDSVEVASTYSMLVNPIKIFSLMREKKRRWELRSLLFSMMRGIQLKRNPGKGRWPAAIPGIPAAIGHLNRRYGALPLKVVLAPAISLAENGLEVDARFIRASNWVTDRLKRFQKTREIFLKNGEIFESGDILIQRALAETLRKISEQGADDILSRRDCGRPNRYR